MSVCRIAALAAVLIGSVPAPAYPQSRASQSGASSVSSTSHQTLLKQYCRGCHNAKLKTADVSLDNLSPGSVSEAAGTWEKVYRKLRTGEMPPPNLPRPAETDIDSFVAYLDRELEAAATKTVNPGSPTIHRLNRAEYSNAIRDLLALDIDAGAELPADDGSYGFDNIGGALTVSPLHMEKYMRVARHVSRLALGTVRLTPSVERYNAERGIGAEPASDRLPVGSSGGVVVTRYYPLDAEYTIRARIRGNVDSDLPPPQLDIRVDGKRVRLFDVVISPVAEQQDTRFYEVRVPLKAGMREIAATMLRETWEPETAGGGMFRRPGGQAAIGPSVEYVLVGGPFNPTGPGETETRKRVLLCKPEPVAEERACAARIVSNLARLAYRRPVTSADTSSLLALFDAGRREGNSFEAGIEMALRGILVSPNFIFRVERDPAAAGSVHRISDLELASRLSFFLWSSIPDDTLLRLAEQGKLKEPAVRGEQVRRMLADPKSEALVTNFAGQWLHLRNLPEWKPDPDKFPEFDESLRKAFQRETELFFRSLLREDRPLLELLDADYTFLNARLARHYRIDGVNGNFFRRVALKGSERGGLLGHGSILTVTSYPTRTSPVLRGKWILENLLASPPPPPPPDVPAIAESAGDNAASLRQKLEQHRANVACAACHARLDPLGFALENFDAVGKFRKSDGSTEIDASGALPGGTPFSGPEGLKKVLLDRHEQFVEAVAEKLLTYALGRGLEYYDMPVVRRIARQTAREDHRFSALVNAIVESTPFQMRRSPEP